MNSSSSALLQSLITAPLLLDDLPEAKSFPHQNLTAAQSITPLNFSQKLGHIYEDALLQLLHSSSLYEVLAKNLQIQQNRHQTLGELDFLLRHCTSKQLIHLELATKFYLVVKTPEGLSYPGPDARDDYLKKLNRLREHQLKLPTLFHKHLPTEYKNIPIITQHLVNGCLFDHLNSPHLTSPPFLNPNCRRGKWLHQNEIPLHFPVNTHFQIIPKYLWPVPFHLLPANLPLETWNPDSPLTRCIILRINDQITPFAIAPSFYPKQP